MVGVNVALPVPVASQSFGGWERSLFGDLYVYGPDAIRFYTRRKTLSQRWPAVNLSVTTGFLARCVPAAVVLYCRPPA